MPPLRADPYFPAPHPFRSRYGAWPSLLLVPFLVPAWTFRASVGSAGLDAAAALTWSVGAGLAAWGFLRLARVLRPDASPLWAPAFLAGTYLWPYAADSYFEPWAAAALALGAEQLLKAQQGRPGVPGVLAGLCVAAAALLKPLLWILAPVFVLAALLRSRGEPKPTALGLLTGGTATAALACALAVNLHRYGRITDFGYGYVGFPFDTPLLTGLAGLLVSPGRGLLFYAPVAILALFGLRRLPAAPRVLCGIGPLVLLLVSARWFSWHGASCWGPRLMLPVLPLLAAPAVLLPRAFVRSTLAVGAVVNLLGVLVAPGAWISYAERLRGPASSFWPQGGSDRVSVVPALAPPLGHAVLLARSAGLPVHVPWLPAGVEEGMPPPGAADCISPRIARWALNLPPLVPMSPGLLGRVAVAEALRGRPEIAALFARESLALDPLQRAAPSLRSLAGEAPTSN